MNGHSGKLARGHVRAVMNEFRYLRSQSNRTTSYLLQSQFGGAFSEDEQQSIDHVRFSASVGSNDRREVFVEGPDLLILKTAPYSPLSLPHTT